jgi:hypothetical protein
MPSIFAAAALLPRQALKAALNGSLLQLGYLLRQWPSNWATSSRAAESAICTGEVAMGLGGDSFDKGAGVDWLHARLAQHRFSCRTSMRDESLRMAACSSTLRSSRMLPRQGWASSSARAFPRQLGRGHAAAQCHVLTQCFQQGGNIGPPFTQRRHPNRQYMQAVKQVLSETAIAHQACQVARSGGDDPHINRESACWSPAARSRPPASARNSLDCSTSGISPISSRNRVPPWARRNLPSRPLRSAPVKAPGAKPKNSASSKVSGTAAMLTLMNGPAARVRGCMNGVCQQFLAGAGLAQQQHRAGRLRGPARLALDLNRSSTQTNETGKGVLGLALPGLRSRWVASSRRASSRSRCSRENFSIKGCSVVSAWSNSTMPNAPIT